MTVFCVCRVNEHFERVLALKQIATRSEPNTDLDAVLTEYSTLAKKILSKFNWQTHWFPTLFGPKSSDPANLVQAVIAAHKDCVLQLVKVCDVALVITRLFDQTAPRDHETRQQLKDILTLSQSQSAAKKLDILHDMIQQLNKERAENKKLLEFEHYTT